MWNRLSHVTFTSKRLANRVNGLFFTMECVVELGVTTLTGNCIIKDGWIKVSSCCEKHVRFFKENTAVLSN